jgi:hypothetical protein
MRVIAASLLVVAPALVSAAVTPVRRGIQGFATWYYTQTGNAGACGAYLNDADFTVAMNQYQYEGSCGKYVTITANGKTTQAKVVDLCPEGGGNCHYGDMDMSPGLFAYFADLGTGKMPMEWYFSDGGSPPPPPQDTPHVDPPQTTPVQEEQPHVEPVPTPIVDSSPVYENVVPTTSATEAAPEFTEPAPAPTPTEPAVADYVAPTEATETTTECTTTYTAEAEATTTPSLAEKLSAAMDGGDMKGLGEAFLELGYLLGNHSDTTTTTTATY